MYHKLFTPRSNAVLRQAWIDHWAAMNSVRNLVCFVLGAAFTAAFVVLLLPAAPCPYTIADLGMRKLGTVRRPSQIIFLIVPILLICCTMSELSTYVPAGGGCEE